MNNPNFSSKNAHTKQKSPQTVMVQSDCPTNGTARGELSSLRLSRVVTEVGVRPTDGAASPIILVCLVESRQRSTIINRWNSERRPELAQAIPKAAIEREQRELAHFVEREQARRSQS